MAIHLSCQIIMTKYPKLYMNVCGAWEYHVNTVENCSLLRKHEKHIIKLSTELESLFIYIHVCHALHVSYFGTCIRIWVTGT